MAGQRTEKQCPSPVCDGCRRTGPLEGNDLRKPAVSKENILTVAVEDYFQAGAFKRVISQDQWYRFETFLERNVDRALDLLEHFEVRATFFVYGWIAERWPELVRRIAERGHEIASRGHHYRSIQEMSRAEFREELARAKEALEPAASHRILGYRLAHGWLKERDLWALEVLAEEGYAYDSSLVPLWRRFHSERWRWVAHLHRSDSGEIWEFPLPAARVMGLGIPVAGGNYFRQMPHSLMKWAVRKWRRRHEAPFVMYFHVWELDPQLPIIRSVGPITRIRHYRNLGKMKWVLEHYLSEYQFGSVADYLGLELQPVPSYQREGANGAAGNRRLERLSQSQDGSAVTPVTANGARTGVTIVVPCFNEEHVIVYLHNTLESVRTALAEKYDVFFLFVDDGSRDGTWEMLHRTFADDPNCTFLRHEKNLGVAQGILTGIEAAKTEIVCSIDCDCSYDPHELKNMIPLLAEGVDVVTASPYHPRGMVRHVPCYRLCLSKSLSFMYRIVLRQRIHTYTSCFRVYRKSALAAMKLREGGFLGVAEVLGRMILAGSKVAEYPTTLDVRLLGESKMRLLRTIVGHLRLLARLSLGRLWPTTRAG